VRNAIVLLAVLLACGCKDKKSQQANNGSGTSGAMRADAGGGGAALPGQHTITLPKLKGTPPNKSKALDAKKSEELSKLDFDGFNKEVRVASDIGIDVRYLTKERPAIMVTINASKCFDCIPMELDKWKAKEAALRVLIGTDLKDVKDTLFEMGATDITKTPYIWQYHVGYNVNPDPATGLAGAYGTAYAIHYNDGVNMIRVVAEYKDDTPKSREDMVNLTPKEDLEQIDKAFMDVFVHAW
jgi:hypothetical protein